MWRIEGGGGTTGSINIIRHKKIEKLIENFNFFKKDRRAIDLQLLDRKWSDNNRPSSENMATNVIGES
mgnify:CR=1 FL=1